MLTELSILQHANIKIYIYLRQAFTILLITVFLLLFFQQKIYGQAPSTPDSAKTSISHKYLSSFTRFYSKECDRYIDINRKYINDSIYIEYKGDIIDTLMIKKDVLYHLKGRSRYKIIDSHNDFSGKSINAYFNIDNNDTLKREGESDTQYILRLRQSIVIYVPMEKLEKSERYAYYVLGDCYPLSETCIRAKIANGQYGIVYYEKGLGIVGYSAANAKCNYFIIHH